MSNTDKLTKEQRRKNMQAVKSKNSKIEVTLSKAMWSRGLIYRKNDKTVFGNPDSTFKKYKIAVFCDSEFWHGKDWKNRKHDHRSNIEFWHKKIERNIERDQEVNDKLEMDGRLVLRYWDKDILRYTDACVEGVKNAIKRKKQVKN